MKKSTKRILCGALSLMMCSTIATESVLRLSANNSSLPEKVATADASFKNVTGQFDMSKLMESFFNTSVLKSEDVAPKYETRTVMVTLAGEALAKRADGEAVTDYLVSREGNSAKADIASEQKAFLQALKKKGIPYSLQHTYDTVINAVAVELDTKYVSEIKQMKGVESVVITTAYSEPKTVDTTNTDVVTNETDVYETGIYDSSAYAEKYGEGTVVAVLDTGLDYTHSAFQRFKSDDVDYAWDKAYVKDVLTNKDLAAERRSGSLELADVYVSEKVPFAYDYADDDADVYPSYSNHGTHVAGIIGGYDPNGYTDKDGNPITDKEFLGVVPDAQLVICKVFTDDLDDPDLGGAVSEDIVAALEDCVKLGVDVINMSLGTSCGFTTTNDGDDEGEMLNAVYESITDAGISLICAASNDYSSGYGGVYGTNLASNPDSGTVGSPSTFASALSVASINGQKASYLLANADNESKKSYVFFEESRDIDGNPFDFVKDLQAQYGKTEFEYVVVPGVGHAADYTATIKKLFKDGNGHSTGRIALVKRGDTTFQEKVEIAMEMGAAGVIIYNNVSGVIRMNLGEIENPVPAVSISMNAGNAMVAGATARVGKFTIDESYAAGPFMSEFSSWGPTHDLKLKPEITAHGGEITSAVPGGYGEQSGTSMATPNMAGFFAIVRSYIKQDLGITDAQEINRLAMQLTMSTAGTVYDQDGLAYSPRKQGAGVAKLENVVGGTGAYLWTDVAENDYRPKIELGDDAERTGEYELAFKVTNFGDKALSFKSDYEFMTETLSSDKLTVSEQAHMLSTSTSAWAVNGKAIALEDTITVKANETADITVTLTLSDADRAYIENSFENGMYVEGFLKLVSTTDNQCDLSIPFLGFYGDWDDAPMLDYTAFEVAQNAQDASVLEEDKIKASVWETLPYSSYYNEKYILPMGGYVYLLPDDADPVYVDEEHCAVSRYNEYYGEGNTENYMTSTAIKAVYAGLLRNARTVTYKLYDEATGEVVLSDVIYRVGKAYAGGGSGVPANVELEISPEKEGLLANGKYRMEFEFFKETPAEGERAKEEDTYSFSFTVDYEAPVLEDARVRFYNYKENNKEKQRIYLDMDVYDNHYAQALMVCYPKTDATGEITLQLATEYPTPVRNANKNGTTTVSVEITDIYEKYGDQLYVQIDDFAVNTCLYQLNINEANAGGLPQGEEFAIADGQENINLDIYGTQKIALVYGESYQGNSDASNFLWTSANPNIADVKNGEIVGLSKGNTKIFVSNRKGATKTINVTVGDKTATTLPKIPAISFDVIKTDTDALVKASGTVKVNAGKNFKLTIQTDPWYHPLTGVQLKWSSSNPAVATVDDSGNVLTLKKGTAIISATVLEQNAAGKWVETLYSANVVLRVQNEFTVSNYTLTDYNGLGGTVVIPTDMNIWYIGEEAFKDNDNIKKIIIPSSVVDIQARAFYNCTALEEVYFVSEEKQPIADADLSMIYENAFYGCTNLKKIDFSNVKTITVAADCFGNCLKLAEVVDMPSIGTMHHRAFAGTALTSVDLTGLHMSGDSVFEGCQKLTEIKTGKFTAIGKDMFKDCLGLRNTLTISTPKIGAGAFSGCTNLAGVKFVSPSSENLEFDIGARAFENCGKNIRGNFTVNFGEEIIRSIGERAFAGSSLKNLTEIHGLEILGANAFANTELAQIYVNDDLDIENLRITGAPFEGLTVMVAPGATKCVEEGGVIYNAGKGKILYVNTSVESEFAIPAGVTAIGDYAFANSKVNKVIFADSVETIGVGAFKNAELTAIDFGNAALKEIPESAFEGSNLAAIELPTSVTRLGAYAFKNSALAAFKGDGLISIDNNAFEGCIAMQTVTLADGVKSMGNEVFAGCTALTTVTMPSVEKLGSYTFFGASALKEVTFGDGATTVGTYTFARTPVQTVNLGKALTEIGEAAFYECRNLEEITLPDTVNTVGYAAFYNCSTLAKVDGLEAVETIQDYAFYRTGLTELSLDGVKYVGESAFAEGKYTKISLPVAVSVGAYAFFNSEIAGVEIPATLENIGAGAFAASSKLTAITVASGNVDFFAEDGVLYRYTNKSAGESELVCYPAARVETDGEYTVKEGAVRVLAYAFYTLNKNAVSKVVLPYSMNAIGDSAFYASGIKEYTFESIEAPVLETTYRAEITELIEAQSTIAYYKGYYYNNFETELYNFTKYGRQESPLTIHYPSNGKGYTNHIYGMYFGTKKPSDSALIEDNTRECIKIITEIPTAEEVSAWAQWEKTEENLATVQAFAAKLKSARIYYNNASSDAGQAVYLTAEMENKLLSVEEALRAVKKAFGIPFVIQELQIAEDSTHKSQYLIGEEFDMTGLSFLVVYDDYSVEAADSSKLQLLTQGKLSEYNKYVELRYEGVKVRVPVSVTSGVVTPPVEEDSSSEESSTESSSEENSAEESKFDFMVVLYIVGGVAVVAAAAYVGMMVIKRKKAENGVETQDVEQAEKVCDTADNGEKAIVYDYAQQSNNDEVIGEVLENPVESETSAMEENKTDDESSEK